jgi:hypothetical protein
VVTTKAVKQFKDSLWKRFNRKDVPFCYLKHVIHRVNPVNVKGMVRNWNKMPLPTQQRILQMFEEAGLSRFVFNALLESAGNPDAIGNGDYGLYQINGNIGEKVCQTTRMDLLDPVRNAECAITIMSRCKKRFGSWMAQVVCYNGKFSSCPWRGYQKCLYKKWRAGSKKVATSLFYPIKVWLYNQIGMEYILPGMMASQQMAKQ